MACGTPGATYTFDSNGNLTNVRPATGNRTTMAYDKENRLVDWKQGAATNATTYKYNGFGQKVNETNATGFNAYALIWDGDDYLGDVVEGVDGPAFANLLRTVEGVMLGQAQDYMVDFLGSITGTTNVTTGAIVNTYRYKPYGAKLSGGTIGLGFFWTGNTGSRSTGRQFAEQYNRARHYSSVTGQWTTRDMLWPMESAYGYVQGNPITWTDPSGRNPSAGALAGSINAARIAQLAAILGISIPLLLLLLAAGGSVYIRNLICAELKSEKNKICGNRGISGDVPGNCNWGDSCLALFYKLDSHERCAAIRSLVTLVCFGTYDPAHLAKVVEHLNQVQECTVIAKAKGCFEPDPCRVPRPEDIPVAPSPRVEVAVGVPEAGSKDPSTGFYH